MNQNPEPVAPSARAHALVHGDAQVRLNATLAAGTTPVQAELPILVARCAVEDDFQVREMLTWAIVRHPAADALPLITAELDSPVPQARSQALHTLSKIGDPASWSHITPAHLHDPNDEVARTAWRAAVQLAPNGGERALADELASELGRGDIDVQRSLARAFVELGEDADSVLDAATRSGSWAVRAHAAAAQRIVADPESTFYLDAAPDQR